MKKLVAFVAAGVLASASAYGSISASAAKSNYDAAYAALAAAPQGGLRHTALNANLPRKTDLKLPAYASSFDKKLGTNTFLWAPAGLHAPASGKAQSLAFSPLKPQLRAETVARAYLGQQASFLRLDRDSVSNARLGSVHDLGHGPIIARFQQYKDGVEVFGRSLNVMMDRNLNAVATSGYFAPAADKSSARAAAPAFAIGADAAVGHAFADMGGRNSPALKAAGQSGAYALFESGQSGADYRLVGTQAAKKVYYYYAGKYLPAWFVQVHAQTVDSANNDMYGYVVSAVDGKVLFRKNLTAYDSYSYRVFAGSAAPFQPEDEPINNNTLDPFTGGPNGDQGRTQGAYNLVSLNNSGQLGNTAATAAAKNDPWLPSGATTTRGNNIIDYANLDGVDGFNSSAGDFRGAISSASTFDYPYTVDADPSTASQRQAAITGQFFEDNWLHDAWYDHGFDEASGNGQIDNYGRGGVGGDPILAQAQDGSGRNNANMSTPPDGFPPIQRMYLWDGPLTAAAAVTITTPAIGSLDFNTASFGPHNFTVSGTVLAPQAGNANGCAAITTNLSGAIALIDRGTCSFKTKTLNAQNAGAAVVIIDDNRVEVPPGLGNDASITDTINIGTVSITQADGNSIKTALGNGAVSGTVNVQFKPDRDGTLDIQIVAHEFFHYVSNRLVGDALGLSDSQGGGMGEGWSDFDAMLLTVRPEDAAVTGNNKFQGAYPLSSYVTFNQYFGIRRYPYSTAMTVNPLTYKHISFGVALPNTAPAAPGTDLTGTLFRDQAGNTVGNAEVHATGEIWCNTLWEIYASLLNDPRYTFAQAKSRMQDYIIEGLKMTPNAPTLLEARNALLAAARATDSGDFTLMAKAFAKRGMGVGAVAPDRSDIQNLGAVESYTALAAGIEVTDATLDFVVPNTVLGDHDGDGVLDAGETAHLTFTLVNNGTATMANAITGQMSAGIPAGATASVSFSNGGAVTVPVLGVGESTQVSVLATLDSATGTAIPLSLTLAFPAANDPATVGEGGTAATGAELDTLVNYDLAKDSTSDDVEDTQANLGDWARSTNGTQGPTWQLANDGELFGGDVFGTGQYWFGADNNNPSDITLTTPTVTVNTTGTFSMSFDHYFAFEFDSGNAGFDGGVIEVSTDGGTTWTDAFDPAVGGALTTGNGYNGVIESLDVDGTFDPADGGAHPGFVDTNLTDPPLEHMVLGFGSKLNGKSVLIRFRVVSDVNTGVFGWIVDNIAFTGASNKPFSKTVADAGTATQNPVAVAGNGNVYFVGDKVTLNGGASTDPYGLPLSYAWTQTAGPAVTLANATTATPGFTAAQIGVYSFSLVVTDQVGRQSAPSVVNLSVTAKPATPSSGDSGGGAIGLWLLLPGFALAGLRRRKRR